MSLFIHTLNVKIKSYLAYEIPKAVNNTGGSYVETNKFQRKFTRMTDLRSNKRSSCFFCFFPPIFTVKLQVIGSHPGLDL